MSAAEIVNKACNYARVLRDNGVGYGDYVEQITLLVAESKQDQKETIIRLIMNMLTKEVD